MEASSAVGKIHRGRRSQRRNLKGKKEAKKKKQKTSQKKELKSGVKASFRYVQAMQPSRGSC